MKESSTSLRVLFAFWAVVGILASMFVLLVSHQAADIVSAVISLVDGIFGAYFLFMLPAYLTPERVKYPQLFVVIGFAADIVGVLIRHFWAPDGTPLPIVGLAVGALICWYLFTSLARIANKTGTSE